MSSTSPSLPVPDLLTSSTVACEPSSPSSSLSPAPVSDPDSLPSLDSTSRSQSQPGLFPDSSSVVPLSSIASSPDIFNQFFGDPESSATAATGPVRSSSTASNLSSSSSLSSVSPLSSPPRSIDPSALPRPKSATPKKSGPSSVPPSPSRPTSSSSSARRVGPLPGPPPPVNRKKTIKDSASSLLAGVKKTLNSAADQAKLTVKKAEKVMKQVADEITYIPSQTPQSGQYSAISQGFGSPSDEMKRGGKSNNLSTVKSPPEFESPVLPGHGEAKRFMVSAGGTGNGKSGARTGPAAAQKTPKGNANGVPSLTRQSSAKRALSVPAGSPNPVASTSASTAASSSSSSSVPSLVPISHDRTHITSLDAPQLSDYLITLPPYEFYRIISPHLKSLLLQSQMHINMDTAAAAINGADDANVSVVAAIKQTMFAAENSSTTNVSEPNSAMESPSPSLSRSSSSASVNTSAKRAAAPKSKLTSAAAAYAAMASQSQPNQSVAVPFVADPAPAAPANSGATPASGSKPSGVGSPRSGPTSPPPAILSPTTHSYSVSALESDPDPSSHDALIHAARLIAPPIEEL